MTLIAGIGPLEKLDIRQIGIDDFAEVRYLHASALSAKTTDALSEAEVVAFGELAASPAYADLLIAEEIYGGWIDGNLAGTASWQANGDDGAMARIGSVFVRPLYGRIGIGSRLVGEVEMRAHQSGFDQFAVSSTTNAVPFFERLGYQIASRGVRALSPRCTLPVAFMRKSVTRVQRSSPPTAA
jgi:predicted N-acetyltransferase YhbS